MNTSFVQLEGNVQDLQATLDTLVYTPIPDMNRHNDGLDSICMFVSDARSARAYSKGRHFTGCWDVDVTPVNDPPLLIMKSDMLGPDGTSCMPVRPAEAPTTFRMNNPGTGSAVPLPVIRLIDVDAEELELAGPAVRVSMRADIGSILRPDACMGVQIRREGPLAAKDWEIQGSVHALDECLQKLAYVAPSDTFEGEDTIVLHASDLGHTGEEPEGQPEVNSGVLQIRLAVVRILGQINLEVLKGTVETTESMLLPLSSLRLQYAPLLGGWRVLISLQASGGKLELLVSQQWLHENGVELKLPSAGKEIQWMSDVEVADQLLRNYIGYTAEVSGSYDVRVTLQTERTTDSWQFDHAAVRPFRVTVTSVNDAPLIEGPTRWSIMAGNEGTLASIGVEFF
jgi:hypothetical protein